MTVLMFFSPTEPGLTNATIVLRYSHEFLLTFQHTVPDSNLNIDFDISTQDHSDISH